MDVTKVETMTEDDGTKVYIYHRPVTLKRKDENGNREVKYRKIVARYAPKPQREARRLKTYALIKSLMESNPDMKSGKLYKMYIEKCKEDGVSEDDQYVLNSFYHILRKIRNSMDDDNEFAECANCTDCTE